MARDHRANKNERRERDLAVKLRASGLRKSAASLLAEGSASGRKPGKLAVALADDLKQIAADVKKRASRDSKRATKAKSGTGKRAGARKRASGTKAAAGSRRRSRTVATGGKRAGATGRKKRSSSGSTS